MNLWDALSDQSPHRLWLIGGLIVLGIGMLVGEPGIASIGLAALITAILALSVPSLAIQLIVWSILSLALAIVLRGLVSQKPKPSQWQTEAEVTVMIPEGRVGEVAYEGTLWKAKCDIADLQIPQGELVNVIGRQGNTLIVMPVRFMNYSDMS
ncbi:MAG: NfeD family protein [Leptolyngbyaceae bacterium]|nr:NfeD family protein [Leptolyngbyaceae bacterium]